MSEVDAAYVAGFSLWVIGLGVVWVGLDWLEQRTTRESRWKRR